ncbi:MAG: hypothetical protein KatS3mg110_1589 [Pirellulaceae bacterium]|nr:MAG: hypothetical protein KatS3mg110_1589 [Pirellulaceae bacterium]
MEDDSSMIRRFYTPGMIGALVGVSVLAVRRWQRRGFLQPVRLVGRLAFFDFQAVARSRRLHRWFSQTSKPLAAERALARFLAQRSLSSSALDELEVKVVAGRLLVRSDQKWQDTSGQMWLDFDQLLDTAGSVQNSVLLLPEGDTSRDVLPATLDELLEWAGECEELGQWEQAVQAYRTALAMAGPRAEWCFQLAEVLYRMGDVAAARERYYMALEIEEDFVEARANLGCVLAELGQLDLAVAALEGARQLAPDFADVYYHLARLLDDSGKSSQAEEYWRRFLELAPESPWAEMAQQRLETAASDQGELA